MLDVRFATKKNGKGTFELSLAKQARIKVGVRGVMAAKKVVPIAQIERYSGLAAAGANLTDASSGLVRSRSVTIRYRLAAYA